MRERWGICCPGPSLGSYNVLRKISQDKPEVLVAVNGAILLADFKFDYWAMGDPEVFWTLYEKTDLTRFFQTRLWVPHKWLLDIPNDYPLANGYFRRFLKDVFPSETYEAFGAIMPFGKDIHWKERTVFMAIALAILRGGRDIKLYGADMAGRGYYQGGLENSRTRHTEKRWEEEWYWYTTIVQACADHGISVTREVP
jgi:hypothetical protein